MKLLTQVSLQSTGMGPKLATQKPLPALAFNEMPVTLQPQTPYGDNLTQMDRSLQISVIIQRTFSRSSDSSLLPKAIVSRSSAPTAERCLIGRSVSRSNSGEGPLINEWTLLDSLFQVLDSAPRLRQPILEIFFLHQLFGMFWRDNTCLFQTRWEVKTLM